MFEQLKHKIVNAGWKGIAVVIALFIAGPEIMIGMELMATIEVLGASTFTLAYWSGVKLLVNKPYSVVVKFEQYSNFFIPTLTSIKIMPQLILHAIPERLAMLSYLFILIVFGCYFFMLELG
ncbi:hypothetical protein [Thalassotalea montiporae]